MSGKDSQIPGDPPHNVGVHVKGSHVLPERVKWKEVREQYLAWTWPDHRASCQKFYFQRGSSILSPSGNDHPSCTPFLAVLALSGAPGWVPPANELPGLYQGTRIQRRHVTPRGRAAAPEKEPPKTSGSFQRLPETSGSKRVGEKVL